MYIVANCRSRSRARPRATAHRKTHNQCVRRNTTMATALELSAHELQGLCQRYLSAQHDASTPSPARSFQVLDYELAPTSEAPAGFLGRHQYLSVRVLVRDASSGAERVELVRFFTKSAPSDNASRMEYLQQFGVFRKEIGVYRELLPQLLRCEAVVAPQCYYACNNLLVFEDLAQQGYRMAAARDGQLDYVHLNCLLKTLAALHAGALVHEVRSGRSLLELYGPTLAENAYQMGLDADHVRTQNFNQAVAVYQTLLGELPQYASCLEHIRRELPLRMARIFPLMCVSSKYRNTLLHGDLWANNAMFQYGKYGDTPIQCRFVDFQLARYAPPALDVVTVLTIPTSRRFREQHMDELLCNYYRYMADFLRRAGLAIETYLPREQYEDSVREFRIVGLIESLLFSHLTVLPPASTQQLTGSTTGFSDFFGAKRVAICLEAFRSDRVYRERLTDMLEDLVDNFVLQ